MRTAMGIGAALWLIALGSLAGCPGDEDALFVVPGGGPGCACWGLTLTPVDQADLEAMGEELAGLGFTCTRAGVLDQDQWYECNWLEYSDGADCSGDAEVAVTGLEAEGVPATAACPCVCDA